MKTLEHNSMPLISFFYGISIYMYFDDHNPPHFHAKYGEFEITIRIKDLSVIYGTMPPRALGLIIEWASLHQQELLVDWDLLVNNSAPKKIDPLG